MNVFRTRIEDEIMKTSLLKLTGILIGLAFVLTLLPQASAAVIWEDDFDDGTFLPEWTVHNGTWTASEFTLKADTGSFYNVITRDSFERRESRTFNFSIDGTVESLWCLRIYPIASNLEPYEDYPITGLAPANGVGVEIKEFYITLEHTEDGVTTDLDTHEEIGGFDGWHTINFTLGSNYAITVHLDGELVLSGTTSGTAIGTPEVFYINGLENAAIDNIVVGTPEISTPIESETTTPSGTTPTNGGTAPPIDTTLLIAGAGVAGIVIVVAVVFMKRR